MKQDSIKVNQKAITKDGFLSANNNEPSRPSISSIVSDTSAKKNVLFKQNKSSRDLSSVSRSGNRYHNTSNSENKR